MRKADIKVGELYTARVNGQHVTVRVDGIRDSGGISGTHYTITNLTTGRQIVFHSAAKFRSLTTSVPLIPQDAVVTEKQLEDKKQELRDIKANASEWSEVADMQRKMVGEQTTGWRECSKCANSCPIDELVDGICQECREGEHSSDFTPVQTVEEVVAPTATTKFSDVPKVGLGNSLAAKIAVHNATRLSSIPETVAGYIPTDEQRAILEAVLDILKNGNPKVLVVNAGAGSGKTSTLRMLEEVLHGQIQYTAYNRSLVDESKTKFKKAKCSTGHGLAYAPVGSQYKHRLNSQRVRSWEVAQRLGIQDYQYHGTPYPEGSPEWWDAANAAGYDKDNLPSWSANFHPAPIKTLKAGVLAGYVSQALKKFSQTADREITTKHFSYIAGIDEVDQETGRRTRTNNDKVFEYLLPFARKFWGDVVNTEGVLPFQHDYYVKCQPAGTKVMVHHDAGIAFASHTNIEKIKVGDRVYGIPDHSKGYLPTNTVTKVGQRQFYGEIITVEVEGLRSEYTPEHICISRVGDAFSEKVVIYLMRRGNTYRIGRVQWQYGSQGNSLGIVTRARDQSADAMWVLSVHDSDPDAALAEATTQHLFGIPGWQFSSKNETMPLEQFWKVVGDNTTRADACAKAHGRNLKYPLWERGQQRNWNRSAVEVRACNLITGMRFCVAEYVHYGSKRNDVWVNGVVSRRIFDDMVYSIEVDGNHTYIANGIGTHNCWQLSKNPIIPADHILLDEHQDVAPVFADVIHRQSATVILVGDENQRIYEWRGACNAADLFPDAPVLYLSQSFRFGQTVADVANGIFAGLEEPTKLNMRGLSTIPSRVLLDLPTDELGNITADDREGEHVGSICYLYRTNASALSRILTEYAKGRRGHLVGKVDEVVRFVEAARDLQSDRSTAHPELAAFGNWKEVQEYVEEDPDGGDLKLMVDLINKFKVEPILKALNNMPSEKDADFVCCTTHKSKGREWDTVILGGDFPPAHKMQDSDRRLLYVAATRPRLVLDLTLCTPFHTYKDKDGNEYPCVEVDYTVEIPTEVEMNAYIERKSIEYMNELESNKSTNVPCRYNSPKTALPAPQNSVPLSPTPAVQGPSQANVAPANGSGQYGLPAGQFTWTNWDGRWSVRGPLDAEVGKPVKVVRKNGTDSKEILRGVIKKFDNYCIYEV
jgi:UvrD-like helicase C-terminal domain/UvrD/REP helicase N-terminal domain